MEESPEESLDGSSIVCSIIYNQCYLGPLTYCPPETGILSALPLRANGKLETSHVGTQVSLPPTYRRQY